MIKNKKVANPVRIILIYTKIVLYIELNLLPKGASIFSAKMPLGLTAVHERGQNIKIPLLCNVFSLITRSFFANFLTLCGGVAQLVEQRPFKP